MKQLNAEQGVTFVFSTHDQRLLQHVRRVVELRDGSLSTIREIQPSAEQAQTGQSEVA
ncbi:hypothetical protein D3C86_2050000 [compost metagenome]